MILGIETSCDETAVALVDGVRVVGEIVASQVEAHRPYGGVVPEVATRQHLKNLAGMTKTLLEENRVELKELQGIGITRGPGLASALLVGLSFGKAAAMGAGLPWVGVNHLEGHLYSPFLAEEKLPEQRHIALIVSGGHTLLVDVEPGNGYRKLGGTKDDAAGEAFDKGAKLLGLNYPGGPEIEKWAKNGNSSAVDFPRGMIHSGDFQFSFSGLKTALRIYIQKNPDVLEDEQKKADACASYQQAIVEVLVKKTQKACIEAGVRQFSVSGGVSCNRALRNAMETMAGEEGLECKIAPPGLSTDNAAMIGVVAGVKLNRGETSPWNLDIEPNLRLA